VETNDKTAQRANVERRRGKLGQRPANSCVCLGRAALNAATATNYSICALA
jgi:hypothetical protein